MHSKVPPRNRLAKILPLEFREQLREAGVPPRKYCALLRATLVGGRVIEEMVVENGWVVALDRSGLAGTFERRVELDVREIVSVEIVQTI